MQNKTLYETAKIEIIKLHTSDIVTASGDTWLGDDGKPNHDSGGWT